MQNALSASSNATPIAPLRSRRDGMIAPDPTRPSAGSTPFGTLPLDVYQIILDILAQHSRKSSTMTTLARCSRVAKSWTEPAMAHLYLDLWIRTNRQARQLAQSTALGRYTTRSAQFRGVKFEKGLAELIVSRTLGLKKLSFENCGGVRADLFGLPSLQALESLHLEGRFENAPHPFSLPFSLRELVTTLSSDQLPVLNALVSSIPSHQSQHLSTLEFPYVFDPPALSVLMPFASFLSTLIHNHVLMINHRLLADFIALATSLSRLSFIIVGILDPDKDGPSILSTLLHAVSSPLKTLELSFPVTDMAATLSGVLTTVVDSSISLRSLSRITFPKSMLKDVRRDEEWSEFRMVLTERGIKLGVKKE